MLQIKHFSRQVSLSVFLGGWWWGSGEDFGKNAEKKTVRRFYSPVFLLLRRHSAESFFRGSAKKFNTTYIFITCASSRQDVPEDHYLHYLHSKMLN